MTIDNAISRTSESIANDISGLLILSRLRFIGTAYLLLGIFGFLGGHRFYTRNTGTAIIQLALTCTVVGAFVTAIWILVDLFLLPDMVNTVNRMIIREAVEDRA